MSDLKGVCVPICTPFKDNGASLDLKVFEANIDSLIENGVHIIAINGGTGEFPFLAEDEKRKLAEVAVKRAKGRVKVIVQTSAIRPEDAVEYSKHADGIGAETRLLLPPYIEGPGEAGVRWHYEQIAKAIKTPIMAYNIPVYTQFDITPEIFARFSEIDGIKYIKDSTADPSRIEKLAGQGSKVFCGCDFLNFFAIVNGAAGLFTGSGNVGPALIRKMWDLSKSGDYGQAEKVWKKLQPISRLLWTLPFNPVAKAGSQMTGRPAGLCRMPVPPLSKDEWKRVEDAVAALS